MAIDGVGFDSKETVQEFIDRIKGKIDDTADAAQPKNLTTAIDVDGFPQTTVEGALGALNNAAGSRLVITTELQTATAALLGATRLLTAAQVGYTLGGIYQCKNVEGTPAWVLISTAEVDIATYSTPGIVKPDEDTIAVADDGTISVDDNFKKTYVGSRADWDLLSVAEKKQYDLANFTDDVAGGELIVSDSVTEGDMNPVTSNAVANYAIAKSELVPKVHKFIMSNLSDQGYPNIDGTIIYANNAGRDQAKNGVRGVSNPTIGRQWPVTSNSTRDEFIALGGLQFYLDKTNDKLWVRFANSVDMSNWKEL